MTRYTPQYVQSGSYAASQDRRLISALWPGPASSGCAVSAATGMTLNIAPGQVAVPSQNNTGSTLCTSDAVEQVILPAAPPSGQNRIDVVIVRPRAADLDGGTNTDFIFDSVQGTPAATPTVPAIPAGTAAIAQVAIAGGSATVGTITDVRPWGLAIAGAAALPPPVTAGSTIQTFVDGSGELYVAKNGVNAGAWRRARDVLKSRTYRNAAWTSTAGNAVLNMDTVYWDDYALYTFSPTFGVVVPAGCGGYWRWTMVAGRVATGAGDRIQCGAYLNGTVITQAGISQAGAAANFGSGGTDVIKCNAGDTLQAEVYSLNATAGQTNQLNTFVTFEYVGRSS